MEAEIIRRSSPTEQKSSFASYIDSYRRLFSAQYRDRTLIGVMIMFFQRQLFPPHYFLLIFKVGSRMERDQCIIVLWSDLDAQSGHTG